MDEENRNTEEGENVVNNPDGTGTNGAAGGESEEQRTSTLDLQKLRKLRKGLRLTQAELAALLGIHRTYLVLIEKGKKIPSPRLERSIIDFMDKAERESLSPQSLWRQVGNANASALVAEPPARRAPVVSWAAAGEARDRKS